MEITIREYEEQDWPYFVAFGSEVANHIADLDPLKKRRHYRDGDEGYANWLMGELKKNNGITFMALDGEKIIGFIAGCLDSQTSEDLVFSIPAKRAWVHDVCVAAEYRSKGVGAKLLKRMEEYFAEKGCDEIALDAFAPNERSLAFYDREGYSRQFIQFRKSL